MKTVTVGTLRERERELHFIKRGDSFVWKSNTHTDSSLIEYKNIKKHKTVSLCVFL